MKNKESILELVDSESCNGFSTTELVAEWGNYEAAQITDGDISVKNAHGWRWLNEDDVTNFLTWVKSRNN